MYKDFIIILFLNFVFLLDLIIIKNLFYKKVDKHVETVNYNTVQEEYEDVEINEFDERISEMKQEILEKKQNGEFEVNQAEVISEEFEKELYKEID
jgi:hypothetical protein